MVGLDTAVTGRGRDLGRPGALAVLATAQLVLALDYSIVNVALPSIARSLGFGHGSVQWVISAYALTFGGFLLLGGRAADRLGRRRMFVLALAVFGTASLAGGFAGSPAVLVASRAVQGLGGAVLFPATLSLITTTFPEGRERNRALAVWGSAGGSGLAVGVLAGGLLTSAFGWRSVLFVNVPIVALLLALAPVVLPRQVARRGGGRYDVPGAVTATAGLVLVVFALVQGPVAGWTSPEILGAAAAGLVLLLAFVAIELRSPSPLMPLRLLRLRTMRGGVLVTAAFMASFGLQFFFLTLYLQQVRGQRPVIAGLAFVPLVAAIAVGANLGARLATRIGVARTLAGAMALGATGLLLYTRLHPTGALAALVIAEIVAGLGHGASFTNMFIAAGTGVAHSEQGIASGMASTAQQVGGAMGLALLVALLTARADALGLHGGLVTAPPHILDSALHATFAAQAAIAMAGALVAAFVIGRPARASEPAGP